MKVIVDKFYELLEAVSAHPDAAANSREENLRITIALYEANNGPISQIIQEVSDLPFSKEAKEVAEDNAKAAKSFEPVDSDEVIGTLEARRKEADGRFVKYFVTVEGKEYWTFSEDLRDIVRKLTNESVVKITVKKSSEFIAIAAHGEQPIL